MQAQCTPHSAGAAAAAIDAQLVSVASGLDQSIRLWRAGADGAGDWGRAGNCVDGPHGPKAGEEASEATVSRDKGGRLLMDEPYCEVLIKSTTEWFDG